MNLIVLIGGMIVICFGFVLLFGAPYVPTLSNQAKIAMDMIDLKPGQTLLELGCGDGKILLAAAERGWNVVGIELNPILVVVCWLRTRRYGGRVKVVWGNLWQSEKWPNADGIFVFILQKHMPRLDSLVSGWRHRPVRLVSFAFTFPDKRPKRSDKRGVYLYEFK